LQTNCRGLRLETIEYFGFVLPKFARAYFTYSKVYISEPMSSTRWNDVGVDEVFSLEEQRFTGDL
jgi:hypothetical protein